MKPTRLRTIMIALVVVSGSALTGVGLGRIFTKAVLADDAPQDTTIGPPGNLAALRAAAAGVRIIYPNPRDLKFSKRPNNFQFDQIAAAVNPIPLWNFNVTASAEMGGANYTGLIMGRSPFSRGKTTTTIKVQIIPLVITINNGAGDNVTYDPTIADGCVSGSPTDVSVVTGSPLFQDLPWTMSGVNVGNTQYMDAFQRAQFWSLVQNTPYHLTLQQSTLAGQALTFGSSGTKGPGTNYNAATQFSGCGFVGVVNINDLDAAVTALITGNGPLAASVNAGTFPIFLTRNVVSAISGTSIFSNCCVLGYHSAFSTGPGNSQLQVYSPFSLDTSGTFGKSDVRALSHELGEAINDPTGGNPTPVWGGLGQVPCTVQNPGQNNLEVGDPLSPGFGTPSATFTVTGANGLTYHLQELAYDTWFYGAPSLGAGAPISSNNSTFAGPAKPCPPGGTH